MKPDPAILRALPAGIDRSKTTITSHGGSGFASTAKVRAVFEDGTERLYFLKTGKGIDAELMFEGEYESLMAMSKAVQGICPAPIAHGQLVSSPATRFLLTEFLDMNASSSSTTTETSTSSAPPLSLAAKLAALHTTPAPNPPGYDTPRFGFTYPTCCGSTLQDNTYESDWAEFFAKRRLQPILSDAERLNGKDEELQRLGRRVVEEVVPRLLGKGHLGGEKGVMPVVVHGDLWSGNHASGLLHSSPSSPSSTPPQISDTTFDPSSCYAHSEYDLGIMRFFGGFSASFYREYHSLCPKTEPVAEYEDRVKLYELYHQLNHHVLFGSGYRGGCVAGMRGLLGKYGRKT